MIIGTTPFGQHRIVPRAAKAPKKMSVSNEQFAARAAAAHAANRAAIMAAMPGTKPEIAKRTGLSTCTVHNHFFAANRIISHISHWVTHPCGGAPAAVHVAGPGESAPRPQPSRNALRAKAWRVRQPDPNRTTKETHGQQVS